MEGGRSNIRGGGGRGRGRGRDRGRGREGRGQSQDQGGEDRGSYRIRPNRGGRMGRGDEPPPITGPRYQTSDDGPVLAVNNPPPQRGSPSRAPGPGQSSPSSVGASGRGARVWTGSPGGPSTSATTPFLSLPLSPAGHQPSIAFGSFPPLGQSSPSSVGASGRGASVLTGSPGAPSTSVHPRPQPQPLAQPLSPAGPQGSEAEASNQQTPKITDNMSQENQFQVMKRPDRGGVAGEGINLLANHFLVKYNQESSILHYDVEVKPSGDSETSKKMLRKSEMALIKDRLFSEQDEFSIALLKTVYDAEKSVFSAVPLPTGVFTVEVPEGEEVKRGAYTFTIKLVNELKLSKLTEYLTEDYPTVPREILQGMDLVMKDNPSRRRICVGRNFYSDTYLREDDLQCGVAAHRGFKQSLKPTSMGLALCLDYSVIAFRKKCSVIEFVMANMELDRVTDMKDLIEYVAHALKGLKVRVNHRRTKQKYTIAGLTEGDACDIYFDVIDPEGSRPPTRTRLLDYYQEKWSKNIVHRDIPCLVLGRNPRKPNYVPMEFCELVEGQRYPNEYLVPEVAERVKKLSLCSPLDRKDKIDNMVQADDGPVGDVVGNFGIKVTSNMSRLEGRIIAPPRLELGGDTQMITVDINRRHWSLGGKPFAQGTPIRRWVLIDFTRGESRGLNLNYFHQNLVDRCEALGMQMEQALVKRKTWRTELSSVQKLENLLKSVMAEKLQLIVCIMPGKNEGYKLLKWVSETKLGVVTQCCLSSTARNPRTLTNLCLKINAKLGGTNFKLFDSLPHLDPGDPVMFIGADVNHPAPQNATCPSIAAVVATVNWPSATRYAARVGPQTHRVEQIIHFGSMCRDLVEAYARANNNVRPQRIVVFRDGVSDGQFQMVLEQELPDLERAICSEGYAPKITVVVAQKRHNTRLFVEGSRCNVPSGTVVDTGVVSCRDFDFYLCSHDGGIGTSKATHYYVLKDGNGFTSDGVQSLIYHLCFTYVRCTKPVSLVPPVYYADLVAYRGRMFQEVVLAQNQTPADMASSSSGAPPIGGNAAFDQSFYNLHEDLKDSMFFV